MSSAKEKPLLQIGRKTMLELVAQPLKNSELVSRVVVVVTPQTPHTRRKATELGLEVIETPGEGYESDMRYAIKELRLSEVLVVSADLPFLTVEAINRAIGRFKSSGKPALAVFTPIEVLQRQRLHPQHTFEIDGRRMAPVGINLIDGRMIDHGQLEQEILVSVSDTLAVNVNTPSELELARFHYEGQLLSTRRRSKSLRAARVSVFSAFAVVGAFIHLPGPVQTVAFDSAPGFLAALLFGPIEGALVNGIGHLATSTLNGMPLGALHIPVALGLAGAGAAIGYVNGIGFRLALPAALALGVTMNIALVVLAVPVLGWEATLLFAPFLALAAIINALAAGVAYIATRGKLRTWI
jgi:adenosylcobinamide-phosphate guanylyltransferase